MSDREDALLERVLQQVDHPGLEDPGLDLKGDERRLWREYGELAGMLPAALEPVEPPGHLLAGLLAGVRSDGASATAPFAAPAAAAGATTASSPRSTRRRSAAVVALAAAATALTLGLALWAGSMAGERSRQRETIAELERRLAAGTGRDQELVHAPAELEHLRSVVTSAGLRACPLRPWGERPPQPWARAVVYFDGSHHQFYLVARDLEPCGQDSRYVLWFMVDGKPVAGGSFRPEKGVPVALGAEVTSESTNGAFLTLERDPTVDRPTGPPILYGEGSEEML